MEKTWTSELHKHRQRFKTSQNHSLVSRVGLLCLLPLVRVERGVQSPHPKVVPDSSNLHRSPGPLTPAAAFLVGAAPNRTVLAPRVSDPKFHLSVRMFEV